MTYSNNDLWSVRQVEFLQDALKGYENTNVDYYPATSFSLNIPSVATYRYVGVLDFKGQDRTVIFEQGDGFGLKKPEILKYLKSLHINVTIK